MPRFALAGAVRGPEEVKSRESVFHIDVVIIVSVVAIIATVLLILIIVVCKRIKLQSPSKCNYQAAFQYEIDIDKLPSNSCYHQQPPEQKLNPALEKLEYPRNDLVYVRDIGHGAFGRVFQAKVPCRDKNGNSETVAVKMLRENTSEELQRDFEEEASLMVKFCHPNIVQLVGVCVVGKPMCLVFEYMSKGDLNGFLRSCSPEHFIVRRRSTTTMSDSPKLDHVEQLDIAVQIAAGMQYITDNGYVHRDLATRNCLVGEKLKVKIADFGLTRKIDTDVDYYCGTDQDAIPIRWMPIESILYNRFTKESDVWSFGVVLWEIFSFALQPYYGMTHDEVIQFIKEGNVLSCPDNTPQEVYDVMHECWSKQPEARPQFRTLCKSLAVVKSALVKSRKRLTKVI